MNRNLHVAAAIAAVLGTGTAFAAATNPPTLAQADGAPVKLYIGGSSAAKNAFVTGAIINLCGGAGNTLLATGSPNANFAALSCAPANGVAGADGNTYYTIYYRFEGGSVTGALPIVNNDPLQEIDLSASSLISCAIVTATSASNFGQNVCTATISGTSALNGIDDSFSGATTNHVINLGLIDVEPAAMIGNNYPTQYATSAWGPDAQAGLGTLAATGLFDQVFGIYVNEGTAPAPTVFKQNPLQLSQQTVQNILNRKIKNWNLVTDIGGNLVTNAGSSLAITIVNRDVGSGSRAAIDLVLMGDTCQAGASTLADPSGIDYYSTGDVLTAANSVAGAITYASIDNSKPNLSIVSLNGVVPSSLTAATGQYPIWAEATFVSNPNSPATGAAATLQTFLTTKASTLLTAPHTAQIMATPGLATVTNTPHANVAGNGDTAAGTLAGLGAATIYTNPFTRGGINCNPPVYKATVQ